MVHSYTCQYRVIHALKVLTHYYFALPVQNTQNIFKKGGIII